MTALGAHEVEGADVRAAAVTACVVAAAAFVLGLVGAVAGLRVGDPVGGVVVRSLVVALGVALTARVLASREERGGAVLAGALAAFLLDPFTWSARTLVGQLLPGPGALAVLADAVLWACVVAAATARPQRRARR